MAWLRYAGDRTWLASPYSRSLERRDVSMNFFGQPEPEVIERTMTPNFNMDDRIDRTEFELCNKTLKLTSSVFGFPDYESLIDLISDGTVRFYGGMVSSELGAWSVIEGDANSGENPDDLYLEFSQPLTERYKEVFLVPGGVAFWRGRLNFVTTKSGKNRTKVDDGLVVSTREKDQLVREGVFVAETVGRLGAAKVIKKAREAFERALTTPKAESSGFKTPARIAGAKKPRKKQNLLASAEPDLGDLDLLEDGKPESRRD